MTRSDIIEQQRLARPVSERARELLKRRFSHLLGFNLAHFFEDAQAMGEAAPLLQAHEREIHLALAKALTSFTLDGIDPRRPAEKNIPATAGAVRERLGHSIEYALFELDHIPFGDAAESRAAVERLHVFYEHFISHNIGSRLLNMEALGPSGIGSK